MFVIEPELVMRILAYIGEPHPAATDLLSPMAPVILKRPSIENTTVLMSHPDAIDQVLDYRPPKTKHKLIF